MPIFKLPLSRREREKLEESFNCYDDETMFELEEVLFNEECCYLY